MISTLSIAIAFVLSGCSISHLSNPASATKEIQEDKEYHKGLASIFPSHSNKKEIHYQGMDKYGHIQKVDRVFDMNGMRVINYQGWMEERTGVSKEQHHFYIDYYINDKQIIEAIKNSEQSQPEKINRTLSIIPKQIILQAPLELNHSWTQEFDYEPVNEHEKEHQESTSQHLTATYTITKIEQKNGHPVFTVETIVNEIEGYYHNTYKEIKTWETGKGLTSFTQSIPMYNGFQGDEQDADTLLMFRYSLAE